MIIIDIITPCAHATLLMLLMILFSLFSLMLIDMPL